MRGGGKEVGRGKGWFLATYITLLEKLNFYFYQLEHYRGLAFGIQCICGSISFKFQYTNQEKLFCISLLLTKTAFVSEKNWVILQTLKLKYILQCFYFSLGTFAITCWGIWIYLNNANAVLLVMTFNIMLGPFRGVGEAGLFNFPTHYNVPCLLPL